MTLSSSTNIINVDNFSSGWARIKNKIIATWGAFIRTVSSITEGDASPTSIEKYGTQELSISSTNIEIDADLDAATGLAYLYYSRYSTPKKMCRIITKMLPQLELGDTVTVNYKTEAWLWWWGKTDAWWGDGNLFYFDETSLAIYNIKMTVVGVEYDLTNWRMNIDVREI